MKVLNLVWSELSCDYHVENFLFGNETAPTANVMLAMIRDKFPTAAPAGNDVCLQAQGSRVADSLYKEVMQYCKDNGYTEYEVPEIIVAVL